MYTKNSAVRRWKGLTLLAVWSDQKRGMNVINECPSFFAPHSIWNRVE